MRSLGGLVLLFLFVLILIGLGVNLVKWLGNTVAGIVKSIWAAFVEAGVRVANALGAARRRQEKQRTLSGPEWMEEVRLLKGQCDICGKVYMFCEDEGRRELFKLRIDTNDGESAEKIVCQRCLEGLLGKARASTSGAGKISGTASLFKSGNAGKLENLRNKLPK